MTLLQMSSSLAQGIDRLRGGTNRRRLPVAAAAENRLRFGSESLSADPGLSKVRRLFRYTNQVAYRDEHLPGREARGPCT